MIPSLCAYAHMVGILHILHMHINYESYEMFMYTYSRNLPKLALFLNNENNKIIL